MFADRILEILALVRVQAAAADLGGPKVWLALAAISATALALDYAHMLYLRSRMPPGPLPWPIVGNTYSLPENKPWIYFEALSKKYSTPVITFWIGR